MKKLYNIIDLKNIDKNEIYENIYRFNIKLNMKNAEMAEFVDGLDAEEFFLSAYCIGHEVATTCLSYVCTRGHILDAYNVEKAELINEVQALVNKSRNKADHEMVVSKTVRPMKSRLFVEFPTIGAGAPQLATM